MSIACCFPREVTTLDLARYYDAIADWMRPDLIDRPLTLVHCPRGVPVADVTTGADCVFPRYAKAWAVGAAPRADSRKTKVGEYLSALAIRALSDL